MKISVRKILAAAGLLLASLCLIIPLASCGKGGGTASSPSGEKPSDGENTPMSDRESELLLGFDTYDEITGAGLKLSKLFGATAVNRDKKFIRQGDGSWEVRPEGDYAADGFPSFRMRFGNMSYGGDSSTLRSTSFEKYDKILLDLYNAEEKEIEVRWNFTILNSSDGYTDTPVESVTLAPGAWTTAEYDLSSEEYSSFFRLGTVKWMSVTICSKKESKDATPATLYFDNLRGHLSDSSRAETELACDFEKGLGFESVGERYMFQGDTAHPTQYLDIERVPYSETGLSNVPESHGKYVLRGKSSGATWPAFTVNFNKTYPVDSVLTFMLYVEVDPKAVGNNPFRMEMFDTMDTKAPHTVMNGKSLQFNRWIEINVRLTKKSSSAWGYINLDNDKGGTVTGGAPVTVYFDNFSVAPLKQDTAVSGDKVTITNPYDSDTHQYNVNKKIKKGDIIAFDIDFNIDGTVAVWVLGDKGWASEWYAWQYDAWTGKTHITVTAPADADFFVIEFQYRDKAASRKDYKATITGIKVGRDTVKTLPGGVELRNEFSASSRVQYVYDKPLKKGQTVVFDVEISPAGAAAVWLVADGNTGRWEGVDEWFAYGYDAWTGKRTIEVTAKGNVSRFRIVVEFRDAGADFSEKVVTISDPKIYEPNAVELKNPGADGKKVHQFNIPVKKGQYVSFDFAVDPTRRIAVWVLANADKAPSGANYEWFSFDYAAEIGKEPTRYDKTTGKGFVAIKAGYDTDFIRIQVQWRDENGAGAAVQEVPVSITDFTVSDQAPEGFEQGGGEQGGGDTVLPDGSVELKNPGSDGKKVHQYDIPVLEGAVLSFKFKISDPSQRFRLWVLGGDVAPEGKNYEWHAWDYASPAQDSYNHNAFDTSTGEGSLSLTVPYDSGYFRIQVQWSDASGAGAAVQDVPVTIYDLTVTPPNSVTVDPDGTVHLGNERGGSFLQYVKDFSVKKGQTFRYYVDVDPARDVSIWTVGDAVNWSTDKQTGDEWSAFRYSEWRGRHIIVATALHDTDQVRVRVAFNTEDDLAASSVTLSGFELLPDDAAVTSNPGDDGKKVLEFNKPYRRGQWIEFDFEADPNYRFAVWVSGGSHDTADGFKTEWYAWDYNSANADYANGKGHVKVQALYASDTFVITMQFRDSETGAGIKTEGIPFIVSNVKITGEGVDGEAAALNDKADGGKFLHTFNKPLKKGQKLHFNIDAPEGVEMSLWVIPLDKPVNGNPYFFEKLQEFWQNPVTAEVLYDCESFKIQVLVTKGDVAALDGKLAVSGLWVEDPPARNRVEYGADGSVTLHNDAENLTRLSYIVRSPLHGGDTVTFDIKFTNASVVAVWLVADGNTGRWEDADEWYAYQYTDWSGTVTVTVPAGKSTDVFRIVVEFRDPGDDHSACAATISNLSVKRGEGLGISGVTGTFAERRFALSVKTGQYIQFTVTAPAKQPVAVWAIGVASGGATTEWKGITFNTEWYENGKHTFSMLATSDAEQVIIKVQRRKKDGTEEEWGDMSVRLSDIHVVDASALNRQPDVEQGGKVTLYNRAGEQRLTYTFTGLKGKPGKNLRFSLNVAPHQSVSIWVNAIGGGKKAELYGANDGAWASGPLTVALDPAKLNSAGITEVESVEIMVQFNDAATDWTLNTVTIDDVRLIGEPAAAARTSGPVFFVRLLACLARKLFSLFA